MRWRELVEFKTDIVWLDISEVKPNDYNPNYMPSDIFESLKDNIKKNKFYGAIIIRKNKTIIDGEHRYLALKALGHKKIPCLIAGDDVDAVKAKLLTIRMNRERGYLLPVETGKLLADVSNTVPQDILSKASGIPESELGIMMNLNFDTGIEPLLPEKNNQKSWAEIENMMTKLNEKIKEVDNFHTIYTVGRGGLVPARLMADRLNISEIIIDPKKIPDNSLFVDDIYDTGKTYNKVMKLGKEITYVTLYHRKKSKQPKNLLFAKETEGDEYIVFPWDRLEYKRETQRIKTKHLESA